MKAKEWPADHIAGVGSWELELPGRRLILSDLARALHEVPPDAELTLDATLDLYPKEARQALRSAIDGAISEGTSWDLELPLYTASGRALWMRSTGVAKLLRGELILLGGCFQDITRKRQAEEAMRHDLLQARALVAKQRTCAAKLNHDVRTPLGTVTGLTYLMARTSLNSDQRDLLGKISAAVKSLVKLIDDADVPVAPEDEECAVATPRAPARSALSAGESGARLRQDDQTTLRRPCVDSAVVARLAGARILVADDSPSYLEAARRVLEREGGHITAVPDGSQVVALLRSTPCAFDAVLMDLHMPVLDGVAAARLIRGELGLAGIPLLAMTGDAQSGKRALEAGMNSIISKPFQPENVVILLEHEIARAGRTSLRSSPHGCESGAGTQDWPAIEGIDGPDVQQRLEGDIAFFTRLLRGLCNEFADLAAPRPYPELAGDRAALAARLHKLGGNASLIGALALREAAAKGEAAMRAGFGVADGGVALAGVRSAMQQLLRTTAPWLTQSRQSSESDLAAPRLDAKALDQWQAQLKSRDFGALSRFQELAPSLRLACGSGRFETLEAAMEKLDLEQALALVSTLEI